MNSGPQERIQAPRPLRRNPWPALLIGAAAIVVYAGNIACRPTAIEEPKYLGSSIVTDVEWTGEDVIFSTWEGFAQP